MAVGDKVANAIYRFSVSGSSATLQGTVSLAGLEVSGASWIDGKTVVLPNTVNIHYKNRYEVAFFKYPAGGMATKTIKTHLQTPESVAISNAPH